MTAIWTLINGYLQSTALRRAINVKARVASDAKEAVEEHRSSAELMQFAEIRKQMATMLASGCLEKFGRAKARF